MKKGSKEAKAWGRKMKLARAKPKKKKSNSYSQKGGVKMVKRRVKRKATRKKATRRKSYGSVEKIDVLMDVGMPVIYGYGREKLSTVLEPVTNRIPLGLISDELVLGVGAYFGNKYLKNKKVKKACKNVLIIESARVGETTSDFGFKKTFTGQ